jgi:multisubunit Na+/H+ antiporter MnhF subunit
MIDTWFFAAFLFGLLSIGAFLWIIAGPTCLDRVVTADAGITFAAAAALTYSISVGSIPFLSVSVIFILILYVGTTAAVRYAGGGSS